MGTASCILAGTEIGVAEETPGAYKDVGAVAEATGRAGLARKAAKLKLLLVCIKG